MAGIAAARTTRRGYEMITTIGQIAIVLAALATGQVDAQGEIKAAPKPPPAAEMNGKAASQPAVQQSGFGITETVVCIVAVLALGVSIWNAIKEREYRRLTARPLLSFKSGYSSSSPHISLYLKNDGFGPVTTTAYDVAWGDHKILLGDSARLRTEIMGTIQAFLIEIEYGKPSINIYWIGEDCPLLPGQSIELLTVTHTTEAPPELSALDAKKFGQFFNNLKIRFEGESIYKEPCAASFNDPDWLDQWDEAHGRKK